MFASGYKDHLPTPYSNSIRQNKETKRVIASTFIANPIALTEQVTDSGSSVKTPSATQDFLQPLLVEIDNQVDNLLTTITVNLDKITAGFHRIQLPDVANVAIDFINCPVNRVLEFFLDFTKENLANTPTVTFNQTVNGLAQTDLDNNDRLVVPIVARDTQDEVRFDAFGVTGGGGGGTGANQFLSNLLSPTAVNQDLLPDIALSKSIGSNLLPWFAGHFGNVEFPTPTGLTSGEVGLARIAVPSNQFGINVPTNFGVGFFEQGVQFALFNTTTADLTAIGSTSVDNLNVLNVVALNDTAADPAVNGLIQRNGTDIKAFSGGFLRNLSDIPVGGAANVFLSNLQSPTSINQDLLFSATGFDIGDTTNPVEDLFVESVRLQEGTVTVNVPMITANAGGSAIFNIPTGQAYIFREQNVLLGSITGPPGNAEINFDVLEANQQLKVNESGVDPIVNGIFTLNAGRVKVFTNGLLRDLTDIGTGGGGGNSISQGDSNVTVTDAGAGQVDVTLDGTNRWRWLSTGTFRPIADGDVDIGASAQRVAEIFVDRIDIQDDQASNPPPANVTTITADQGGLNVGVAANNDSFDVYFDGVVHYQFENDRIQFAEAGRQHRIDIESTFLRFATELENDTIHLQTGTGRTNENLRVADLNSIFKTETTDTTPYEVLIRYGNPVTGGQPAIGNVGFEAEDSANAFRSYAGIVTAIDNDSSVSRDGRMQLVVADGDSAATGTTGLLSGIGFDVKGNGGSLQISFFGNPPVVQQNPAVNATAIHAALQSYGLFV